MIRLKIDTTEVTVKAGATILDAAREAGISIPTLCHRDGIEHYTSCLVCMVRDLKSGNYLPSCTMPASEGMMIDASGDDVIALRKSAVELLLSEHRADCEGPCRVVCPAGYNIPKMNRLLSEGNIYAAVEYLSQQVPENSVLWCYTCAAYCENACRRKKIDLPVSIRDLSIFIYEKRFPGRDSEFSSERPKPEKKEKSFGSITGKMDSSELTEWLKESGNELSRHREIISDNSASSEAKSCLHCDCRASEDCRLRDAANLLKVKDPRGKLVNAPAVKKINTSTNLIFENAKCIKCGICVRICEDSTAEPALCFLNRGFVSILSEPLTHGFDEVLINKAHECIEACPTGALEYFKKQ